MGLTKCGYLRGWSKGYWRIGVEGAESRAEEVEVFEDFVDVCGVEGVSRVMLARHISAVSRMKRGFPLERESF